MTSTAPIKRVAGTGLRQGSALRATQRELSIHVPVRRPLMPMKAAMLFLERNENHVLSAIPDRIRWAFDIHCKGDRANVLIYRASAEHCHDLDGNKTPTPELETVEAVIASFLPTRPILRGVELQRLFTCSQDHIGNLISAGLLRLAPNSPTGHNISPFILRETLTEFLKERRYLP